MALAKTGIVGDIRTGDIGLNLLGGGIGNHGISGDDLSRIFGAQAQAEVIQSAQEREERRQRLQLTVISISVIATILFILFLFYLFTRTPKPSS